MRIKPSDESNSAFQYEENFSEQQRIAAFKERQHQDLNRRRNYAMPPSEDDVSDDASTQISTKQSGTIGNCDSGRWRNAEGESLDDFGVDEDAEIETYDDENMSLSELIRNRKATPL